MIFRLFLKRIIARKKIFFIVAIGILLACTTLSGSVMYFESLRNLALDYTFSTIDSKQLDIKLRARERPITKQKYDYLVGEINQNAVDPLTKIISKPFFGVKTWTFLPYPANLFSFACEKESSHLENCQRFFFSYLDGFENNIELISGDLPKKYNFSNNSEIEVIVSREESEKLKNLQVGSTKTIYPYWEDEIQEITIRVSGIYDRVEKNSDFWEFYDINFSQQDSTFSFAGFFISKDSLTLGLGEVFSEMGSEFYWDFKFDSDVVHSHDSQEIIDVIDQSKTKLSQEIDGFVLVSKLPGILKIFDKNLVDSGTPMRIVLIIITVVIIYFIYTLMSLILDSQNDEIEFLNSRGTSVKQIIFFIIGETILIAIICSLLGPFLAIGIIQFAGLLPWLAEFSQNQTLYIKLSNSAFFASALGGVVSLITVLIPAFLFIKNRSSTFKRNERPKESIIQKYYIDIGFLVIALLALWQVSERGSLLVKDVLGDSSIDNLTLIMPSLILIASGVFLLRFYPIVIKILSWLLTLRGFERIVPSWLIIGLWQIARNPSHYRKISLLLILSAGLGVFASSFESTLDRSLNDRAKYEVGADSRLTEVSVPWNGESVSVLSGEKSEFGQVMPVYRSDERVKSSLLGDSFQLLAVDPDLVDEVIFWRSDFSSDNLNKILDNLKQSSYLGIPVPENVNSFSLELNPRIDPEFLSPDNKGRSGYPPVAVLLRISDSNNRFYSLSLGTDWEKSNDGKARQLYRDFRQKKISQEELLELRKDTLGEQDLEHCYFKLKQDKNSWCELKSNVNPNPRNISSWGGNRRSNRSRGAPFIPSPPITLHSISITQSGTYNPAGAINFGRIKGLDLNGKIVWEKVLDKEEDWTLLNTVPNAKGDTLVEINDNEDNYLRFQWTPGQGSRNLRGFSKVENMILPAIVSNSFIEMTGAKINDILSVSLLNTDSKIQIKGVIDYFPTLNPNKSPFVILNLYDAMLESNAQLMEGDYQPNEIWLKSYTVDEAINNLMQSFNLSETEAQSLVEMHLGNSTDNSDLKLDLLSKISNDLEEKNIDFLKKSDINSYLNNAKIDPLTFAGWQTLLIISFMTVSIVSIIGYSLHARSSFNERVGDFASLKGAGMSIRQVLVLVLIEQLIIVGIAVLLGMFLGSRLSSTIMPYLITSGGSFKAIPPMVNEINWLSFSIIFSAFLTLFFIVIASIMLSVKKLSVHNILRTELK
ncbi:MAG: hypothetical protein CL764_00760 [Chloroflexi bacterium]|nr:hypothetical protein [Chloroflexota bacterium]|tara:strand:+ start:5307 stop:8954 length:3648 start_codon:yes stop_codon:yes gene_type:complete